MSNDQASESVPVTTFCEKCGKVLIVTPAPFNQSVSRVHQDTQREECA